METVTDRTIGVEPIVNDTKPQTEVKSHDVEQSGPRRLDDPERREVSWAVIGWLGFLHLGVLVAPLTFTLEGLILAVVLHWATGGLGVCLGFHRLLTHSSFQTHNWVRWFFAWVGGMAGEGSAIDWVANHRKHHAHSDQEGDPHSPVDGKWWSHVFWLAWCYPKDKAEAHIQRWAPDLAKDPVIRFLGKTFLLWHFLSAGVLFLAGYAWGGMPMACSFLVWGVFVRLCFVLHTTWFVNSASHIWGYRNYTTTDQSKNNWWVALISYGEGWHNNHHAFPRMAAHGHRWWEIDVTFFTIRILKALGLAWDVVDYKRGSEKLDSSGRGAV